MIEYISSTLYLPSYKVEEIYLVFEITLNRFKPAQSIISISKQELQVSDKNTMLNVFNTKYKGVPPNSLLILRKFKQIN